MTWKHSHTAAAGLIATAIVTLLAPAAIAQDRIVPLKGAGASGKITDIQRDQVTINVRGKDQPPYKINEISKVIFDDEPSNLDRARDFINGGQFDLAESELGKIDVSKITDQRIASDVQFYKGYVEARMSLAGMGDAKPGAAVTTLLAFVNAAPDSHHTYKAAEVLGDLAMALNRPDLATKYYGELSSAPFPELKALATYKQGEVKLTENDTAAARSLFQKLTEASATDAETTRLKNLGEVGLAICDARDGKSQEALAKLQELVKKHDSSDQVLFARIYNAMGMCYQALGQKQQALLAYLRTDLLFPTSPDLHAEALYQLAQLWPDVGQPQRSTEARQRLTSRYPSSPWNNKK